MLHRLEDCAGKEGASRHLRTGKASAGVGAACGHGILVRRCALEPCCACKAADGFQACRCASEERTRLLRLEPEYFSAPKAV